MYKREFSHYVVYLYEKNSNEEYIFATAFNYYNKDKMIKDIMETENEGKYKIRVEEVYNVDWRTM